jgi:ubiquinone/menaquinone biosynthesis C-methylase UbiE
MTDAVASHYAGSTDLAALIRDRLRASGKSLEGLKPEDLGSVDEFHIRGRAATLEIGRQLDIDAASHVLDIGSGLGGPARTIAEAFGCRVTGVDLTPAFCSAANAMSEWVGLSGRTRFQQGDATELPFPSATFDAAMTIHVAMNIPAKDRVYAEARRVLKPGSRFAVYDVLKGEGDAVLYPVPWAREPSISFVATPDEMVELLTGAGFRIIDTQDTTDASQRWFEAIAAQISSQGATPAVTFQAFLGDDYPQMTRNQVRNLTERRIRTVTYICEA